MPYIAGTDIPQQIVATCPRCKTLRTMSASNDGAWGYICNGCEWGYQMGAGVTIRTTSALNNAGDTALTFASGGTSFSMGQYLYYPGANPEIILVTGPPTATSVPVSTIQFAHATAQNISLVTVVTFDDPNQQAVPPNPGWGF